MKTSERSKGRGKKRKEKERKKETVKLPVYSKSGKKSGDEIELNPAIFCQPVNERLLHTTLTSYAANQRRGTADTKERAEVRGGGKKPWRQKGTGRARAGSIRSPLWRGGGTTFGPHPRDYSVHIPKEIKRKALISALSLKCKQENIMVVEDASVEQPKTREVFQMIKALKLTGSRTLCVVKSMDEKLKRATSNLRKVFAVREASDFNAYHVLRRKKLLIDLEALGLIEKRLLGESGTASSDGGSKTKKEKVPV